MSRKHNCRHDGRMPGGYKRRLTKRGLHRTPELTPLDTLRSKQCARIKETGAPWPPEFGKLPDDREFTVVNGMPLCHWKKAVQDDDEYDEIAA